METVGSSPTGAVLILTNKETTMQITIKLTEKDLKDHMEQQNFFSAFGEIESVEVTKDYSYSDPKITIEFKDKEEKEEE